MRRRFERYRFHEILENLTAAPPWCSPEKTTGDCSSGVCKLARVCLRVSHVCCGVDERLVEVRLTEPRMHWIDECACWVIKWNAAFHALNLDHWSWRALRSNGCGLFWFNLNIYFPSISICLSNYLAHFVKFIKNWKMIQIDSNFFS